MRFLWILTVVCSLVSLGLLMIILSQIQVVVIMSRDSDKPPNEIRRLDGIISNLESFKDEYQLFLDRGNKDVQELETFLGNIGPEIEKKKANVNTCNNEKKTKADELASVEKELAEIEDELETESDTWKMEIDSLKSQLVKNRPICNYVKDNTKVKTLCAHKEKPVQPAASE